MHNMKCCIGMRVQKWGVGGGSNIAQLYCNRYATVWAMQIQVGGCNKRMTDLCAKKSLVNPWCACVGGWGRVADLYFYSYYLYLPTY